MAVRVIDLETTGLDPATDRIIEIAAVDLRADKTITDPRCSFVQPDRDIPPASSAVHHLIAEDMVGAPSLAQALAMFDGADVYVAHNCSFEKSFLTPHWGDKRWLCTFKCALRLWPDDPGHSNQELRYRLGLVRPFGYAREAIHPHRAASDVIVTAAILAEQMRLASWGQLLEWSEQPALHTRLRFGKHRGERFDAVDPSYIDWLLRQPDLDADVRYSAEHWCQKQGEKNQ